MVATSRDGAYRISRFLLKPFNRKEGGYKKRGEETNEAEERAELGLGRGTDSDMGEEGSSAEEADDEDEDVGPDLATIQRRRRMFNKRLSGARAVTTENIFARWKGTTHI